MIILDGPSRRVILDAPAYSAAQIWSAWVDWLPLSPQWPLAFNLVGGIDLGGGAFIPPYFFLRHGWRVRPMEASHVLKISGNLVVEGGGDPVVPTLGNFNVSTQYTVPVVAQGLATGGGLTVEQAAQLTRLIDLAEADEELTETLATLRKRGTATVLLEKTVAGGTITPVELTDV